MSRSHCDLQRAPSAPHPILLCRLLSRIPHTSLARQGLPGSAPNPAWRGRKSRRHPESRRPASPLRTPRRLISSRIPAHQWFARRPARRRLEISVSEVFRSRSGVSHLWFGSQPVSFERINSTAILAVARILVQMEFLVGTRPAPSNHGVARSQHDCADCQYLQPRHAIHDAGDGRQNGHDPQRLNRRHSRYRKRSDSANERCGEKAFRSLRRQCGCDRCAAIRSRSGAIGEREQALVFLF